MEAYTGFAEVYDLFMEDVPYEEWGSYLEELLTEYGIEDGLVLDLGCGTGVLTEFLAAAGYDMTGIDRSEEMLEIAAERREASGHDILYLCQDMREFELYGTVRAIVCNCDAMNYILEEEELLGILSSAAQNYLDYGGLFIFDLNTEYKYRELLGEQTIAENRDEGSFIWENLYHDEERINEYDLTVFVRRKEERETFRRFCETHYQRGYTLEEMSGFVKKAGMKLLASLDADTHGMPDGCSERIYMICRKE